MTNYEKYRKSIDLILQKDTEEILAFNKNTEEVAVCQHLDCEDCLFYKNIGGCYCSKNTMRWLVAEYTESEVDWSKVPVDTPVLISVDNRNWFNRYFAGVNEKGQPTVFCYGATQWSNGYEEPCYFKYIKLAEVSEYERIT